MSDQLRFRLLFALLMSLQMSLLMTAWVTWINIGMNGQYLTKWLHSFLLAWPAAYVIVLLSAPTMQRITRRLLPT